MGNGQGRGDLAELQTGSLGCWLRSVALFNQGGPSGRGAGDSRAGNETEEGERGTEEAGEG